ATSSTSKTAAPPDAGNTAPPARGRFLRRDPRIRARPTARPTSRSLAARRSAPAPTSTPIRTSQCLAKAAVGTDARKPTSSRSPPRNRPLVEPLRRRRTVIHLIPREHSAPSARAEPGAQLAIAQQPDHLPREILRVSRLEEQPRPAVRDHLLHPVPAAHHNRR